MEPSKPENSEDALQSNVRRMEAAILQAQGRHAAYLHAWMNDGAWPMSRRQQRRLARQLSQHARREDWKRRRGPAWVPAVVFFALGFWFLSVAHRSSGDANRWLGVAFILGAIAFLLRNRSRGSEGEKVASAEDVSQNERPPLNAKQTSPAQGTRAEPDRTEALCEKLIQAIRAGPQPLREVVHRPEETIASLRKACSALRERESSLRALDQLLAKRFRPI